MKTVRTVAIVTLLGLSLAACGKDKPEPEQETSLISSAVKHAVVEAREEIEHGNITLGHEDGLPKAEITPKGDLLIDGKAVAVNAEQRALLLKYRGHVADVAEAGMQIGMQGADLATKAMGEAMKGIFSGKSEAEIEKSVEAEAAKIKVSAAKLCERLPAMMATQQELAAALPEFKPYADMTQSDIDDCVRETEKEGAAAATELKDAAREAASAAGEAADAAQEAADAAQDAAAAAEDAAKAVKQ